MGLGCKCCGKLEVTTQDIYVEEYMAKTTDSQVSSATRNTTLTRTALGRWDVTFTNPHPDGVEYHPTITAEEQSANRDTPDITVVQGTITANGFSIQITTGDNGGGADVYVDTPFSLGVSAPVTVVTGVTQ